MEVLPTLAKDSAKKGKKKNKNKKKGAAQQQARNENQKRKVVEEVVQEQVDDEVITPDTDPASVDDEATAKEQPAVEVAQPFSDGIVSARLANLTIIPRAGGQDMELLKGFLKYYSMTESAMGTMSSRMSFMKKKGGLLL